MGRKRKLVATASCEDEGGDADEGVMVDRFSNLPDEVTHHIFSFLDDLKYVIRMMCVSKRCREFCLSTQSLHFWDWDMRTRVCSKQLELMRSLDSFLVRRGNNKIRSFQLYWEFHRGYNPECFCDESSHIRTWIHNAVMCSVEELDLRISGPGRHLKPIEELPFFILLSTCLRSLTLAINVPHILKAPSLSFLSNLKYLDFRQVNIVDEEFFKWVSCSCKFLKEMRLTDCYGIQNMTLDSSSLEILSLVWSGLRSGWDINISGEKLEHLAVMYGDLFDGRRTINLFAPNLKYMTWCGNWVCRHRLVTSKCLEEACFLLWPLSDEGYHVILEVLRSIRSVNVLTLDISTTKAALAVMEGAAPLRIDVGCMNMIIEGFYDNVVPGMVSLFRSIHNLNTLYLRSDKSIKSLHSGIESSGFDSRYWKSQNLDFANHLGLVNIELCNGSNGFELAKYILGQAQNLKEMVIVHLPDQFELIRRKFKESKKVSNAVIVFHAR